MSTKLIKVQTPKKFFWNEVSVDKDIVRYRDQEREIRAKIEEYKNSTDKYAQIHLRTYENFLRQLLESKELLANKIGKQK